MKIILPMLTLLIGLGAQAESCEEQVGRDLLTMFGAGSELNYLQKVSAEDARSYAQTDLRGLIYRQAMGQIEQGALTFEGHLLKERASERGKIFLLVTRKPDCSALQVFVLSEDMAKKN